MSLNQLVEEHEIDVAWLISLWLAIHGGDPGPEGLVAVADETSVTLAAALIAHLEETAGVALHHGDLEAGAAQIGFTSEGQPAPVVEDAIITGVAQRNIQYCFKYNGQTICTTFRRAVLQFAE